MTRLYKTAATAVPCEACGRMNQSAYSALLCRIGDLLQQLVDKDATKPDDDRPFATSTCSVCDVTCTTHAQAEAHWQSKPHKHALDKAWGLR